MLNSFKVRLKNFRRYIREFSRQTSYLIFTDNTAQFYETALIEINKYVYYLLESGFTVISDDLLPTVCNNAPDNFLYKLTIKSYKWQSLSIYKHILPLYFCISTNIEQQMYLSLYEDLCNMSVLCETGVCHHGKAEDSNPLWCDTLPLDVLFTTSQFLMYLQNMTKSHPTSQSASDPRRPDVSWQWHVLTSRRTKNVWSNTISMVHVAKFLPYRDVCRWDISDLWTESNFVYSHSLTLSFTRPITHTLIRSLMCSGITSFGPIEM